MEQYQLHYCKLHSYMLSCNWRTAIQLTIIHR